MISINSLKLDPGNTELLEQKHRLNGMGVLSPMEYKWSNGEKFTIGFRTKKRSNWSASKKWKMESDRRIAET